MTLARGFAGKTSAGPGRCGVCPRLACPTVGQCLLMPSCIWPSGQVSGSGDYLASSVGMRGSPGQPCAAPFLRGLQPAHPLQCIQPGAEGKADQRYAVIPMVHLGMQRGSKTKRASVGPGGRLLSVGPVGIGPLLHSHYAGKGAGQQDSPVQDPAEQGLCRGTGGASRAGALPKKEANANRHC